MIAFKLKSGGIEKIMDDEIIEAPFVSEQQRQRWAALSEQSRQRLVDWKLALEALPSVRLCDENLDADSLIEGWFDASLDEDRSHTVSFSFDYNNRARLSNICDCGAVTSAPDCPARNAGFGVQLGTWTVIYDEMRVFLEKLHSSVAEAPR